MSCYVYKIKIEFMKIIKSYEEMNALFIWLNNEYRLYNIL